MIVSARSDLPTKLRGFDLGASDYLAKPFSLDELVARVRVQLRRAHGPDEDGRRPRRAARPSTSRAARRGSASCVADLSDREFRLLHHLVEHAGEVVSRERLLSEVWGYHFDPGSNVVDVCVRRLRKKLGEEAPIETVRHAGYRLRCGLDRSRSAWVALRDREPRRDGCRGRAGRRSRSTSSGSA